VFYIKITNKIYIFKISFTILILIFQSCHALESKEYSESYILSIDYCNYLEFISEYSTHNFIVKINSSSIPVNTSFNFSGRFFISNFSIELISSSERYISIIFEVYEKVDKNFFICDLDNKPGVGSSEIILDTYTGFWHGDDQIGDLSGLGRFNGCDDESYYDFERDFELCFSIDVIDQDKDRIPKWYEENIFFTDPLINDANIDYDLDNITTYWEYKWEYDPFVYEYHKNLDSDKDGLNNYEEYLTSNWSSDPHRKDIFVELDQMEPGDVDYNVFISNKTINMVYQTYAKRNIVFHVDDGCMGGGQILPYDNMVWFGEEKKYYQNYFLNNDPNSWRRGVFRYALYVNDHFPIRGMEFPGENSITQFFKPGLNSYVIATKAFKDSNDFLDACIMLHELGHTLGVVMGRPLGCDNQLMRFRFSIQKIIFKNYKSVMNYQYCNTILDYSDGSHGIFDSDDWSKIDLTYFQPEGAE